MAAISDREKKHAAKTPCIFHAKGYCARGSKCFYQHDGSSAKKQLAEVSPAGPKSWHLTLPSY